MDRILGGGMVPGSLVLIGGEPGIGKSTLSLQIPLSCSNLRTLYVTGEESAKQVGMRAKRLGGDDSNCSIFCETLIGTVIEEARAMMPDLMIVDSVQTMYTESVDSAPGSVSQVREVAAALLRFAKESGVPVILIGHITKDGFIAGPKILEHIVDVVLQFEGENRGSYRILRSIKNRFGSTSELAVFEMTGAGLREVANPSELLIPMHEQGLSGTAIAATLDGTRPMLFEVQALVSSAVYGTAQRSATGFDARRLNMLLAVLEKRAGFHLSAKDVFLNMAGGLKVSDPAVDLAVICAVLSSNFDFAIPSDVCFGAPHPGGRPSGLQADFRVFVLQAGPQAGGHQHRQGRGCAGAGEGPVQIAHGTLFLRRRSGFPDPPGSGGVGPPRPRPAAPRG